MIGGKGKKCRRPDITQGSTLPKIRGQSANTHSRIRYRPEYMGPKEQLWKFVLTSGGL